MLSGKNSAINDVSSTSSTSSIQKKLAELETSFGGRLGISAVNTGNNQRIQYRENERFPMGCTSKVIGIAAVLKESMVDSKLLQEKITYKQEDLDLAKHNPITQTHLADGMTIEELSSAAISFSDNTAMNLLVNKLGGLQKLNSFARSIGDGDCKFDHMWPEEAYASPHSTDDSTTPFAMEKSLQKLVLSNDVLAEFQREKLQTWMINNTTGNNRIRAGVPQAQGWTVGDKTGTGAIYGTTNDIAVIWPPQHDPIVVAVYYSHEKKEAPKNEKIITSATAILLDGFAGTDQRIKLRP